MDCMTSKLTSQTANNGTIILAKEDTMETQTTKNTIAQSPIMNDFVEKTFEAFKSAETVQTQHASKEKLDTQKMIDLAMQNFDKSKIKFAAKGRIDTASTCGTKNVGLQTCYSFKTKEALENSTFVASKDQDFADLKANFSAKGISGYSYGLTKRPTQAKSATRFDMLQEVRRNFKGKRNCNGTKGFISANSAIVCGEKLKYEKKQMIKGMETAQKRLNAISDFLKPKKSNLSVSFASLIAENWRTEKKAKTEKIDNAKVIADKFKAEKTEKKEMTREQREDAMFSKLREKAKTALENGDDLTYERINTYLFHVGA